MVEIIFGDGAEYRSFVPINLEKTLKVENLEDSVGEIVLKVSESLDIGVEHLKYKTSMYHFMGLVPMIVSERRPGKKNAPIFCIDCPFRIEKNVVKVRNKHCVTCGVKHGDIIV